MILRKKIPLSNDPYLTPYLKNIESRKEKILQTEQQLTGSRMELSDFASGHEYYGLHPNHQGWVFREWAPNAAKIYMIGDFSGWQCLEKFRLKRLNEIGRASCRERVYCEV